MARIKSKRVQQVLLCVLQCLARVRNAHLPPDLSGSKVSNLPNRAKLDAACALMAHIGLNRNASVTIEYLTAYFEDRTRDTSIVYRLLLDRIRAENVPIEPTMTAADVMALFTCERRRRYSFAARGRASLNLAAWPPVRPSPLAPLDDEETEDEIEDVDGDEMTARFSAPAAPAGVPAATAQVPAAQVPVAAQLLLVSAHLLLSMASTYFPAAATTTQGS